MNRHVINRQPPCRSELAADPDNVPDHYQGVHGAVCTATESVPAAIPHGDVVDRYATGLGEGTAGEDQPCVAYSHGAHGAIRAGAERRPRGAVPDGDIVRYHAPG